MKESIIEKWGILIVKKFSIDKRALKLSRERKILKKLESFPFHTENASQLYCNYLGKKLGYFLLGIVLLFLFIIGMLFMSKEEGELVNNTLYRNESGGLDKEITFLAKSEGIEEEITVSLEAKRYEKEQLDTMALEVYQFLEKNILLADTSKTSTYVVRGNTTFPTIMEGYPFLISWESSNKDVLDDEGIVSGVISANGEKIFLTIILSCYEYEWKRVYEVYVYPEASDWTSIFGSEVQKAIAIENEESLQLETVELPQNIAGHQITYEEKRDNSVFILIALGVIVLFLSGFLMDSKLSAQVEERNKQLLYDYSALVSKLTLYLGVGLSLQSSFIRITNGIDRNRFLHQELERVVHEMENGVSDDDAIEGLAKRCQLSSYVKFSVLIRQNLKKGNNKLCEQLKAETDKAFEERKNQARKFGEEAGTKLLFPMILMLVVVMIMIMYPAFVSFSA